MKRPALMLVALGLELPTAATVSAKSPEVAVPFTLVHEVAQNNPTSPPWCLNEDDHHERAWGGTFAGEFFASEYFCVPGVDISEDGYAFWDGGGVGMHVELTAVGLLERLQVRAQGVTANAVLTRTETVGKGKRLKTYNTYTACIFPISENLAQLITDTATVEMAGDFSEARLQVTAEMFGFAEMGYPSYCPAGQRP